MNSKAGLNILCFASLFSPNYLSDKGVAVFGVTRRSCKPVSYAMPTFNLNKSKEKSKTVSPRQGI